MSISNISMCNTAPTCEFEATSVGLLSVETVATKSRDTIARKSYNIFANGGLVGGNVFDFGRLSTPCETAVYQ